MDSISEQIKQLWANANPDERRQIRDDLQDLAFSFDTDWDVIIRLASGPLIVSLAKIGINWKIFKLLTARGSPVTIDQFVQSSGASVPMLRRLLRTQAAYGLIEQTGIDEYKANRMTTFLNSPNVPGAVAHVHDNMGPQMQVLPDWFNEKKSLPEISKMETAFQKAFNTTLSGFGWMNQYPERMEALSNFMAVSRDEQWLDKFSVLDEFAAAPPGRGDVALVDIGGGFGQQATIFHQRYPQLGRVVVQDTANVVQGAKPVDGVEFQAFDFFQPQPVHAKLYYFRHVLHNWTDEDCVKILKATIPAMRPNSRIVIDDVALPDVNVPWQAAWLDMVMATALGACERTRTEWETLLQAAGLKVVEIVQYDPRMQCAIIAVPA
ncbi:S-adenosyl-L-methionine-dependent methyltransferase [Aspergillus pseudoustus]|uniref:S-adenosyl-L-methionine-dependent methyltransferase n=1 Tax=Aspergillus pseudoustus TaxID=1810923 RepID=A0ABR4KDC7_9EURO